MSDLNVLQRLFGIDVKEISDAPRTFTEEKWAELRQAILKSTNPEELTEAFDWAAALAFKSVETGEENPIQNRFFKLAILASIARAQAIKEFRRSE